MNSDASRLTGLVCGRGVVRRSKIYTGCGEIIISLNSYKYKTNQIAKHLKIILKKQQKI
jgi:hypothetical protein